jgi:hypothetical protein
MPVNTDATVHYRMPESFCNVPPACMRTVGAFHDTEWESTRSTLGAWDGRPRMIYVRCECCVRVAKETTAAGCLCQWPNIVSLPPSTLTLLLVSPLFAFAFHPHARSPSPATWLAVPDRVPGEYFRRRRGHLTEASPTNVPYRIRLSAIR